jgi:O-antigen/teichoic acid export membrane protein
VKHTVRRTLVVLGAGVLVQRLCQLLGFVLIGRALGVDGLGRFAQGQAFAAVLTVFAGAGVRSLTARTMAASPGAARSLLLQAVRRRLATATLLATVATAFVFVRTQDPWFWTLCLLQVLPAAFDMKALLDTSGRTRREVHLETATACLQLVGIAAWATLPGLRLDTLAAIALVARSLYALGAMRAIVAMPDGGLAAVQVPRDRRVATAHTAHELLTIGDVWMVAQVLGEAAAGYYAVGVRFAAAALMPSAQLARLLLPHLLHAGADGDPARTLGTAIRSTLLVTMPMLAGGAAAANALATLNGPAFAAAAPALCLLLLGGCLQHLGWQCSHALLAAHRDSAYAHSLGWPALLQFANLAVLPLVLPADPALGASMAASGAVLAQGVYAVLGLATTRALWRARGDLWQLPLVTAIATGAGTALPTLCCDGPLLLPLQLLAGGGTFAAMLWRFELRGRWTRLGDGLATASGYGA